MNPSEYTITIPSVLSFGLFTDCVKDSVSSAINYLENAQVVDEIALKNCFLCSDNKSNDLRTKEYCRFLASLLSPCCDDSNISLKFSGSFTIKTFLGHSIESIKSLPPESDEMWWYLGCMYHSYSCVDRSYVNSDLIENVLSCIINIKSVDHKKALAHFILQKYYPRLITYPSYDILGDIEALFGRLDGYCAKMRHEFVRKFLLKNKGYFKFEASNPILNETDSVAKKEIRESFTLDIIPDTIAYTIEVDKIKILKFSAHLCNVSLPILSISLCDLSPEQNTEFNGILRNRLRVMGYCNQHGFLIPSAEIAFQVQKFRSIIIEEAISYRCKRLREILDAMITIDEIKKLGVLEVNLVDSTAEQLDAFNKTLIRSLKKRGYCFENDLILQVNLKHNFTEFKETMIDHVVKYHENQLISQYRNSEVTMEDDMAEIESMVSRLSCFPAIQAVFLFYKCLVKDKHGLETSLLRKVTKAVKVCFEICYLAHEYQEVEYWNKIAEKAVESLDINEYLLIQTGSPIQRHRKRNMVWSCVLRCDWKSS